MVEGILDKTEIKYDCHIINQINQIPGEKDEIKSELIEKNASVLPMLRSLLR